MFELTLGYYMSGTFNIVMALPFFALGLAAGLVANRTWDWVLPRRPFARGYCQGVADAKHAVRRIPGAVDAIDRTTAPNVVGMEIDFGLGDTSKKRDPPSDDLTVVGG